MVKRKKKKHFEEQYFTGWFKRAVGEFTSRDLELSRRWFSAWIRKLGKHVPLKKTKGKKVLEIGCSIGGAASLLHEQGYTVYASDISKYAVKNAKKLSPKINFSTFDVQKKIPLKQKFDLVISFEVVEHLENPEKAIKNMYKVVKDKGYLVFSSPYPYKWHYNDPTHINIKYPAEWLAIMKKIGLKKVQYHQFALIPFFYRFSKHLHVIIPFAMPFPLFNNPIFFIGRKNEK